MLTAKRRKRTPEEIKRIVDKIEPLLYRTNPVHTASSIALLIGESDKFIDNLIYGKTAIPYLRQINKDRWESGPVFSSIVECVQQGMTPEQTAAYLDIPWKLFRQKIVSVKALASLFRLEHKPRKEMKPIEKSERRSKYTTQDILNNEWLMQSIINDLTHIPCNTKTYIVGHNNITQDVLTNAISLSNDLKSAYSIYEENRIKHPPKFKYGSNSVDTGKKRGRKHKNSDNGSEVTIISPTEDDFDINLLIDDFLTIPRLTKKQIEDRHMKMPKILELCVKYPDLQAAYESWREELKRTQVERGATLGKQNKKFKSKTNNESVQLVGNTPNKTDILLTSLIEEVQKLNDNQKKIIQTIESSSDNLADMIRLQNQNGDRIVELLDWSLTVLRKLNQKVYFFRSLFK